MTNQTGESALEYRIYAAMQTKRRTFAAAESCTGGLILHRLTNVPGSSEYVMGGVVVYSNDAKVKFVSVQVETLKQYGAVSEPVAREMARGARTAFGVDVAVSVTGIAGPGGATETKPVGLTYIGLSGPDFEQVVRYVFTGDRAANKQAASEAALQLVYDYLNRG